LYIDPLQVVQQQQAEEKQKVEEKTCVDEVKRLMWVATKVCGPLLGVYANPLTVTLDGFRWVHFAYVTSATSKAGSECGP